MYTFILFAHVLAATIWTGGHLILAIIVLPRVLKEKNLRYLTQFESGYEKLGVPALIVLVATGFWLAYNIVPDVYQWVDIGNPAGRFILAKISLLVGTVLFAIDARLRIHPNLTEHNLRSLAFHIVPVTVLSVLFVLVSVFFKAGWFY